ncbi:MAG: hypothetical protein K2Y37_07690 [Pirellulales bacterium]|nr:hypothetical protein [Pirellulales bacterium]
MSQTPAKRWYRFRLSTVLILTSIAAWGMATPLSRNNVYPNPHLAWPALTLAVYVGWKRAWATPDENRNIRPWLIVGVVGVMDSFAIWLFLPHLSLQGLDDRLILTLVIVFYLGPLLLATGVAGLLVTLWRLSEDPRPPRS